MLHAGKVDQDLQAAFDAIKAQQPQKSIPLFENALEVIESEDPVSAEMLFTANYGLITALLLSGDIPRAEQLGLKLEPVMKEIFGEKSFPYVAVMETLGISTHLSGQHAKAVDYYNKFIELQPGISEIPDERRYTALLNKSLSHKALAQFIEALDAQESALTVLLKNNPEGNDEALNLLGSLANIAAQSGDADREIAYLKRRHSMSLAIYGENHQQTRDALEWVKTKQRDRENNLSGDTQQTLGNFSLNIVQYGVGFPEYEKKNLAETVAKFGSDHPLSLQALSRYADSLFMAINYEEAIRHYDTCLEKQTERFGENNAIVADLNLRLANAHRSLFTGEQWKKHMPLAKKYSTRAVELFSGLYGDDHLKTILALNQHWELVRFDPGEQKNNFELTLRIWKAYTAVEKRMLPYMHKSQRLGFRQNFRGLQDSFLESAWSYSKQSFLENSLQDSKGWDEVVKEIGQPGKEETFDEMMARLDKQNQEMDDYLQRSKEKRKQVDRQAQEVIRRLYDEWVNYKGSISAFDNSLTIARNNANDDVKARIDALFDMKKRMATLTTQSNSESSAQILSLRKEISGHTRRLLDDLPGLAVDGRFNSMDVSSLLEADTVFIDFARYTDQEYMVFVVEPTGRVNIRRLTGDIGGYVGAQIQGISKNAGYIDKGIKKVRNDINRIIDGELAFSGSEKILNTDLQKLYDAIVLPISDLTLKYKQIIVAPDGMLSLLPFSILRNSKTGKYLLEDYVIRTVPSARELLRLAGRDTASTGTTTIYANPDFNAGSNKVPGQCASSEANRSARDILIKTFKTDCINALPATEYEAKAISRYMQGSKLFTGKNASEESLLKQSSPGILHIATHGFFVPDPVISNPLEKSGLILSGANTSLSKGEKAGIVTGLSIASMDLSKTRLVVLSACETGVGDVQYGEGVAGLNQAFIRAGSSAVIMSLWRVPDEPTAKLMELLYSSVAKGKHAGAALRDAQLQFIRDGAHPLAWAAFVFNG